MTFNGMNIILGVMEPNKLTPKPVVVMPTTPPDMSELPYAAPNFRNDEVLGFLTDDLADFIEYVGDREVYKEKLKELATKSTDSLKLPGILKWLRGIIIKYVISWLYEAALGMVLGFLRGMGKKQ